MPTNPYALRRSWPALALLVASALLYASLSHRHPIGFFGDDTLYILCARSLWSGHYLDLTRLPPPPEIHCLPGFPVLLALFVSPLNDSIARLHMIPGLLAVLSAGLAWLWFRRWFPERWAWLALALYIFNPLTLVLSDILLSEWWLVCLSLSAFLLIGDLEKDPTNRPRQILLALVLTWTALTRPEGILLSVSWIGTLCIRPARSKSLLGISAFPVATLAAWLLRNFLLSGHVSAYTEFWQAPGYKHLFQTWTALIRIPYGLEPQGLGGWILVGIGGMILLMGLKQLWEERGRLESIALILYLFLYMVLHSLWSVFDERFFLPILPFLYLLVVRGGQALVKKRPPYLGGVLAAGLLLNLLLQILIHPAAFATQDLPLHTLSYIREHLPQQATLLANKSGLLTLYTNRFNSGTVQVNTADELAYDLLISGTSAVWVKRQSIADPHVQDQWMRASRWLGDWASVFPVLFNDLPEASTLYAVHVPPSFKTAYALYLDAHQALQARHAAEAGQKLEAAIRVCPDFPGALNDYAVLRLEQGDVPHAQRYLQAALEKRPHFALARLNLARVYHRENKLDLAKQTLQQAAAAALDHDEETLRKWIEDERRSLDSPR